jgi:uncharacterized membrane protein
VRSVNSTGSALAGFLGIAGLAHFVVPGFYDAIVPRLLPGSQRNWVLASGAAEIACAAVVATPRTRRLGATVAAILFVVVLPANVQMAVDWRNRSILPATMAFARLPLQVPLIWWAWRVGHPRAAPQRVPSD